jgi:hypothetical protein
LDQVQGLGRPRDGELREHPAGPGEQQGPPGATGFERTDVCGHEIVQPRRPVGPGHLDDAMSGEIDERTLVVQRHRRAERDHVLECRGDPQLAGARGRPL